MRTKYEILVTVYTVLNSVFFCFLFLFFVNSYIFYFLFQPYSLRIRSPNHLSFFNFLSALFHKYIHPPTFFLPSFYLSSSLFSLPFLLNTFIFSLFFVLSSSSLLPLSFLPFTLFSVAVCFTSQSYSSIRFHRISFRRVWIVLSNKLLHLSIYGVQDMTHLKWRSWNYLLLILTRHLGAWSSAT